jgi:eukaryotic-like serine/threonine-protein kinase
MTPNPRGNRPAQEPARAEAGGESASKRSARSDTPPPIALPKEAETGPRDGKDWDSRSPAPRSDVSGPLGVQSQFTPSFTLVGSGPRDPSRPSSQAGLLAPGSMFGVYLVGSCIGQGGMARIYQAEHAGLRRRVALKVLIDGFARDLDGRERFLREARLAASIKHPNVVNIFDVGVCDDVPYLVMELLEGQDLEQLLQTKGALDEATIVDIMIPVVAGLSAVHDAGIVHRDLKPGNIFLAQGRYNDTEPKVLDFGISKAQGPEQMRLTANRGVMGTPFYISPEGVRGAEMTPRSDQYSLGVVMYECATGSTPFNATAFHELSRRISSGEYTLPTVRRPELSKRLSRIIERSMSLEPENRFKDMREMGRELLVMAGQRTRITWGLSFGEVRDLKREAAMDAAAAAAARPPERPSPPPPRRPPVAPVLIGLAPLLLIFLFLFVFRSARVSTHQAGGASLGMVGGQESARAAIPPAPTETLPAGSGWIAITEPPKTERVSPTVPTSDGVVRKETTRPAAVPSVAQRGQRSAGSSAGGRAALAAPPNPPWALQVPLAAPSPSQTDIPVGSNGSPILP